MKKIPSGLRFFLYSFLFPACAMFTTVIVLFYISTDYLKRDKVFILLFAAFAIAAANLVFYIKKINVYFRTATHFILLTLILVAVLWLSDYMQTGNWVLILIGYLILYALICPIVLILRAVRLKKQKEQKPDEYEPKFK